MARAVTWIGWTWEFFKLLGQILWPIRFTVVVIAAMCVIFFLPQGQDALYGEIIEGTHLGQAGVMLAVTLWAWESWYSSRFLLYMPPAPILDFRYTTCAFRLRWDNRLQAAVPRLLGAVAYVAVAFALWHSHDDTVFRSTDPAVSLGWWLWPIAYGVAGAAFYAVVSMRRFLMNSGRRQAGTGISRAHYIAPLAGISSPVPDIRAMRTIVAFGALWVLLGILLTVTAIRPVPDEYRSVSGIGLIAVLALASAWSVRRFDFPLPTKAALWLMIAIDASLLMVSSIPCWEARFGAFLGPSAALMLAGAMWIGASSFFIAFPGHWLRIPVTTLLLGCIVIAMLATSYWAGPGGSYDNHAVRTLSVAAGTQEPQTLSNAFLEWHDDNCKGATAENPCPMILVALEGGASRSAYWGAKILGVIEDNVKDFHSSVFAISSVSGGSLGAAVFQRLLADMPNKGQGFCHGANTYAACGSRIAEHDFLGPDFFSMFGADLVQRLLPGSLLPDRAEALERSWENAWRDETGRDDFSAAFQRRSPYDPKAEKRPWLPVLLLNGASVTTGDRVITSDVALNPDCLYDNVAVPAKPRNPSDPPRPLVSLPASLDFFCLTRATIRLSTAVNNSARFPYLSPAGTLRAKNGNGHEWKADRIADGGYFDSLGGQTIIDIVSYFALSDETMKGMANVRPIVIAIENDPNDLPEKLPDAEKEAGDFVDKVGPEGSPMSAGARWANDVLAPPIGLWASRGGHENYSGTALRRAVGRLMTRLTGVKEPGDPAQETFLRINLRDDPTTTRRADPAMSWYLSSRSVQEMDDDFCASKSIRTALDALGRLLGRAPADDLATAVRANCGRSTVAAASSSRP